MKKSTFNRIVRVGFTWYILWRVDKVNEEMFKRKYGIK